MRIQELGFGRGGSERDEESGSHISKLRVGNIIYFKKKTTNKANYKGKKQREKSTITRKINEIIKEKYEKEIY